MYLSYSSLCIFTQSPHLDDIMSLITSTSISWGTDPRVTSHELTKLIYLFFRISCHSLWPISHVRTIPIKGCAFLYALIIDASVHIIALIVATFLSQRATQLKASSKRPGV